MNTAALVEMFFPNGNPFSLRITQLSNFIGIALSAPRSEIKQLLARPEADKPGIYFLIGYDDDVNQYVIYIGEAESIKKRIRKHDLEKDFWNKAVFLVSKDDNLTKAHVKYLEGKFIEIAKKYSRIELKNAQASGATLSEANMAVMDDFLNRAKNQLLPVLGDEFKFLNSHYETKPVQANDTVVIDPDTDELLYFKIKGLTATAKRVGDDFVILAGSQAVLNEKPSGQPFTKTRRKLIENGVLIQEGNHYVFQKDYIFSSPSGAGNVVCGGAINGWIHWKDSNGISLREKEKQNI